MHIYTHMQMLITQYTHSSVPAMHAHTRTKTNKRARMHTLRNKENYTCHIQRK